MNPVTPVTMLLQGANVVSTPGNPPVVADVLIKDGVVVAMGPNLPTAGVDQVIVLTPTHYVIPGLIDLRTHGHALPTLAEAALAGGFTTVCVSPETKPVNDNVATWSYFQNQVATYPVTVALMGALTPQLAGTALTEFKSLQALGCNGFSNGLNSIANPELMRLALIYSRDLNLPIFIHPEEAALSTDGCMNAGYYATVLGLRSIPNAAESVVVARDIELLRDNGGRLHFCHITTAQSVALIRQAKADGLNVTADVTPHHVCLTDAVVVDYDPDFKINPPLRSETDRLALIEGLKDGTIDVITTDHTPFIPDEKALAFDEAPFGTIGLETAFAACYTELVLKQGMGFETLLEKWTTAPAKLLGLPVPSITEGKTTDLVVVDTQKTWTVNPSALTGTARNTCFKGQVLTGQVQQVMSKGHWVVGCAVKEPTLV